MGFYQWFDKQDTAIKVLLLIPFWGWIFSFLYRLDKFIENKDTASLIGWILCLIIGFIVSIVDIVTVLMDGTIKILVSDGENFGINGKVGDEANNEKTNEEKTSSEEVKEETKSETPSETESDENKAE
ncbi:MAG: hypothetical protein K6E20_07320 [Acholeplasmatales bacterium]|nr:hypothetical protein [Acholeplasmatales bacterium]